MIVDLVKNEPKQDVIDTLEGLLERAKTGEIRSLAAIIVRGGTTGNLWAGMDEDNMAVIGELRVLERDLIDSLVEIRVNPQTGERND